MGNGNDLQDLRGLPRIFEKIPQIAQMPDPGEYLLCTLGKVFSPAN